MNNVPGGIFDSEAALRYLIRELSDVEVDEPLENPHIHNISQIEFDRRQAHLGNDPR